MEFRAQRRACGGQYAADRWPHISPVVYEVDGEQYITIATGGNQLQGSSYGDAIWTFSLKGQLGPLWAPPPPANVAGPVGPIAPGADTIKIGDNNVEYAYSPARTRIKAGPTGTSPNVGCLPPASPPPTHTKSSTPP